MSRPALPGGKADVEISFGRALLGEVDAAAAEAGMSRSEWVRLACRRLLDELAAGEVQVEELDEAADDRPEPPAAPYLGPTCHPPRALGRGRWVARYPGEWTDDQAVAGLREVHPGAVVLVHRQAHQVLAYTEEPAWVRRQIEADTWRPAPWVRVYGLEEAIEAGART